MKYSGTTLCAKEASCLVSDSYTVFLRTHLLLSTDSVFLLTLSTLVAVHFVWLPHLVPLAGANIQPRFSSMTTLGNPKGPLSLLPL